MWYAVRLRAALLMRAGTMKSCCGAAASLSRRRVSLLAWPACVLSLLNNDNENNRFLPVLVSEGMCK